MPEGRKVEELKPGQTGDEAGGAVVVATGRDLAADALRPLTSERFTEEDLAFMMSGVAQNTVKALRRAWGHVILYTGRVGEPECPMEPPTLVRMIRDYAWNHTGRYGQPTSPETIKHWLWAITKAHKVARRPDGTRGYPSPVETEEVRRAMRAYRKKWKRAGYRTDAATPIAPEEQWDMVQSCDVRSPIGLRDALALAMMYDAGLRAGELVVTEERDGAMFEDMELHLPRGFDINAVDPTQPWDIELTEDDYAILHIPESKTDPDGQGADVFLYAHPQEYAANCSVRLFLCWRKLLIDSGLEAKGAIMRVVEHGGRAPADGRPKKGKIRAKALAYDGLVRIFNRAVEAAGLEDPEGRRRHFVLHGMRAGAAEAAAAGGADTPELNRHFRWSQLGNTAQRYAARGRQMLKNPVRRIWGRDKGAAA